MSTEDERDFWYRKEGRTPIVRHMADRSYTIRAWVTNDSDTVEFEIFKVVAAVFAGEDAVDGPVPAFWQHYKSRVRPSAEESLDLAEREFYGGVRAHGCADWVLEGDRILEFHICGKEHLDQMHAVLCACQDWASHLIPGWFGRRSDAVLPFLPEAAPVK